MRMMDRAEGRQPRLRRFGVLSIVAVLTATTNVGSGAAVAPDTDGRAAFVHGLQRHEARVNAFTRSAQDNVAIAATPEGGFVVAWDSRRQEEGTHGVYLQRYDAAGLPIGGERHVNLHTRNAQMNPSVAVDGLGGVWVAWESFGQDGSMNAIIARRFDKDARAATNEILVNQKRTGQQSDVVVAADSAGQAIMVWTTPGEDLRLRRVVARRFDREGQPLGDEYAVSAQAGSEALPTLALDGLGRVIVAWSSGGEDGRPMGIHGRILDRDGKPLTGDLVFSSSAASGSGAIEPSVSAGRDGRFAVAWLAPAAEDYQVWVSTFDEKGTPRTEATPVSPQQAHCVSGAALAMADDGAFIISWNASGDGDDEGDIFTRFYDANGVATGGVERVTDYMAGRQRLGIASGKQRVSWTPDGRLAYAWSGDSGRGDDSAANVTLLVPADRSLHLVSSEQAVAPATEVVDRQPLHAEPHVPPVYDPNTVSQLPFGGDTEPFARGADVGFIGIINTGWNPPDPHLAVGPSHIVVMTNGAIAFYTKDGTQTFQDEIEDSFGFWGSVGATGFIFDPEVLYDPLSGRFFAMAAEGYAPGSRSYALVAVSDDSDPNGAWHRYRFQTSALAGDLFDSPNIAVDANAVYITGDGFGLGANYPILIYDKASLLAGVPPVITRSMTLSTTTQSAGIPPVSFGNPPALYMAEHREGTSNTSVRLIALTDPLGSPTVTSTNVTVPAYGPPEDPPQQGTSWRPETFDQRFWSVAYRNGSLWAVHHQNSSRVRATWYEFRMNNWPVGGTPELVQSGSIDPGSPVRTFFPSITVDAYGTAVITCARSSPTEFISMAWTYRTANDPMGEFRPLEIVKQSAAPFASTRWGDYSGTQVDPAQAGRFWGHHEYTPGGTSWNTWIAGYTAGLCPNKGDLNGDCHIDLLDWVDFAECLDQPANPLSSICACYDFNANFRMDLGDVAGFQNQFTGPAETIPGCGE